jgi:hypothetical protein
MKHVYILTLHDVARWDRDTYTNDVRIVGAYHDTQQAEADGKQAVELAYTNYRNSRTLTAEDIAEGLELDDGPEKQEYHYTITTVPLHS